MKLSTKTRYGLRAMVDLARGYDSKKPISISEVARRQNLSESYLEQLFAKLRRAELVKSVRGAQGGYLLSRAPAEIMASEIIAALEGSISFADCVDAGTCERGGCCPARILWEKMSKSVQKVTSETSLQGLIDEYDANCKE